MGLKNDLSHREKVMAWEAHRTMGIEQNDIAMLYGVNNGRVNEAIKAIDYAVANTREIYNIVRNETAQGKKA
jgi:predicted transcriptional regulator